MQYSNSQLWFRYEMRLENDPQAEPIMQVLVLKEGNRVLWRAPDHRLQRAAEEGSLILSQKQLDTMFQTMTFHSSIFRLEGAARPETITEPVHYYSAYFDAKTMQSYAFNHINLEFLMGDRASYPNLNAILDAIWAIAYILVEAGVDNRCFFPMVKAKFEYSPLQDTYWLYNIRELGRENREFTRLNGEREWLEHYYFRKEADGRFTMNAQAGWGGWAASNSAGGSMSRDIPPEWLTLSWEGFLDKFEENMPTGSYFYNKEELASMDGLKRFLGFEK